MQACGDFFCFGDVGTVAEDVWVAVVKNSMGNTKEEAKEAAFKDEPMENGGSELCELLF